MGRGTWGVAWVGWKWSVQPHVYLYRHDKKSRVSSSSTRAMNNNRLQLPAAYVIESSLVV